MYSPTYIEDIVDHKIIMKEHAMNVEALKLTCENMHTSFMSLVLKYDVWRKLILYLDHNTLIVP